MATTTKTAVELEAIILEKLKTEAVCPAGFKVRVRQVGPKYWTIDCIPPEGVIAYADRCTLANRIAMNLRLSYSLTSN